LLPGAATRLAAELNDYPDTLLLLLLSREPADGQAQRSYKLTHS